jgi:hypothetical protein
VDGFCRDSLAGSAGRETHLAQAESRQIDRPRNLSQLREKIAAPLFDPNDPEVKAALGRIRPDDVRGLRPIDRDLLGKAQIESAVAEFQSKYGGNEIVVIYSGAGTHGWLGAEALQRKGFAYIPAALQPVDGKLLDKELGVDDRIGTIKEQLIQGQRVIGALAYPSYATYYGSKVSSRLPDGGNVFIGVEETGLHGATIS